MMLSKQPYSHYATTIMVTMILLTTTTCQHGDSFSLKKIDIEGVVTGGKRIFRQLSPECFVKQPFKETKKNIITYTNHAELMNEIAGSVGLSIKELEAKGSLNANHIRKKSSEVSGTLLEVIYLRYLTIISDECLEDEKSDLDPAILVDLAALPYPVAEPHRRASWRMYDAFLYKWGTHILKSTEFGAKATYHLTTSKKSNTDKSELLMKICAKLPHLGIDGCTDAGPKTSDTKTDEDEKSEVYVLGGNDETQAKLRDGNFAKELLDTLSHEAASESAPIKHTWISLPKLLNSLVSLRGTVGGEQSSELIKRSVALLSYYKGYRLFNCEYMEIDKKPITKFMNIGSDEYPEYQCRQVMPGCQKDSDCRTWLPFIPPCYCAGTTCMSIEKEGTLRQSAAVLKARNFVAGRYSDNDNYRCSFSLKGCICDLAGEDLVEVWPSGTILFKTTAPKKESTWTATIIVISIVIIAMATFCRCCMGKVTINKTVNLQQKKKDS